MYNLPLGLDLSAALTGIHGRTVGAVELTATTKIKSTFGKNVINVLWKLMNDEQTEIVQHRNRPVDKQIIIQSR